MIRRRRMVRNYSTEPVDNAAIQRIVQAGLAAPTAGHSQGTRLAVITDPAVRQRLAAAAGEAEWTARGYLPWLGSAPVHIVLGVREDDYRDRYAEQDKARAANVDDWTVPYWWFDAGAALEAMLLATVAEGLGAGFLGEHAIDDLATIVGWTDVSPAGLVTIGYPAVDAPIGSAVTRDRRGDRVTWIREKGHAPWAMPTTCGEAITSSRPSSLAAHGAPMPSMAARRRRS